IISSPTKKIVGLGNNVNIKPKWKIGSNRIEPSNKVMDLKNPKKGGSILTYGDSSWYDYIMKVTLDGKINTNSSVGIVFRYQDELNYYCLEAKIDVLDKINENNLHTDKGKCIFELIKVMNGKTSTLLKKDYTM